MGNRSHSSLKTSVLALLIGLPPALAAPPRHTADRVSPGIVEQTDTDAIRGALDPSLLRSCAEATATAAGDPIADLNLSVVSNGTNAITVAPGSVVHYQIIGELSNDSHQGLALFGLNLVFDGGDLEHADIPVGPPTPGCDNPMANFTRPWGITNPDTPCPPACGFGGTIINGDLIQVGGGQNTINNTPANPPFPIGPVLLGVATPGACGPATLVTGTLTAPETPGTYTLSIPVDSVFANVISPGDPCEPIPDDPSTFCPAEAAGIGAITNLTIDVIPISSAAFAWVPIGTGPDGELPPGATIDGNQITLYTDGLTSHRVYLELRLGDWDPNDTGVRLKVWQASLDAAIFSGEAEALAPAMESCAGNSDCRSAFGGFCDMTGEPCGSDSDCPLASIESCQGSRCIYPIGEGGYCEPGWTFCGREPTADSSATGYCEYQFDSLSPSYRWIWTTPGAETLGGIDDPQPFPADGLYGGTLVVETPMRVDGTFDVGFLPAPDSIMIDQNNQVIPITNLLSAQIQLVICGGGDCQGNGIGDECDLQLGISADCNGNGVPDECETLPIEAPILPIDFVPTNRYLAFEGRNAGTKSAIRVTFRDLPPSHDALNGVSMWVGPPQATSENAGSIAPIAGYATFNASSLQCDPYYTEWSSVGTVYTHGEHVIPGGVYELQAVSLDCPAEFESSYSAALSIQQERWGDVCGPFDGESGSWTDPDGQVSFPYDVVAIMDKFAGLPMTVAKIRADIAPAVPDRIVTVLDFSQAIDAFQGRLYPFTPDPQPCP